MYTDFESIRQEISEETDRLSGTNKVGDLSLGTLVQVPNRQDSSQKLVGRGDVSRSGMQQNIAPEFSSVCILGDSEGIKLELCLIIKTIENLIRVTNLCFIFESHFIHSCMYIVRQIKTPLSTPWVMPSGPSGSFCSSLS